MQEQQRPLLVGEAADFLRVSRWTIRRWINDGTLVAIGAGRTTRIPVENLLAMRRPPKRSA